MPSLAASSLSAEAMSKACAPLSSAQGPAIKASGRSLPKRALPTVTMGFGFAVIIVLPGDHDRRAGRGQLVLLHGRKCRRPQESACDIGDNGPVLFTVVAHLVPGGIRLKRVPLRLAIGKRVPGKHVMQIMIAVADQDGPEAGLFDAVPLPDFQRVVLEPAEQRRQSAGNATVDALFVDHGRVPSSSSSGLQQKRAARSPYPLHWDYGLRICRCAAIRNDDMLHQPALLHGRPDE